ncbi:MAG: hypothetical protein ACRCZF_06625, partial [Gemmataceae bacterium]
MILAKRTILAMLLGSICEDGETTSGYFKDSATMTEAEWFAVTASFSRVSPLVHLEAPAEISTLALLSNDGGGLPCPLFLLDLHRILAATTVRESLRFRPLDRRLGAIGQQYDDQILSRALTDRRLEQAADALLSYSREELPRAIAYILRQISTRANLPTREVSIGLFRSRKSTFEIESDAPTSDEALAGVIAELAAATPALRQLGEWLEPADLL